jgi:hypothetical protein
MIRLRHLEMISNLVKAGNKRRDATESTVDSHKLNKCQNGILIRNP